MYVMTIPRLYKFVQYRLYSTVELKPTRLLSLTKPELTPLELLRLRLLLIGRRTLTSPITCRTRFLIIFTPSTHHLFLLQSQQIGRNSGNAEKGL